MDIVIADIVIGVFYQTNFGVVQTYGFSRREGSSFIIAWYKFKKTKGFRNFYEWGSSKDSETKDWKRLNIDDFPESVDKTLPYSFDLFFDIKRMSQLRNAFRYENPQELLEMMKNHGVFFKKRIKVVDNQSR